MSPSNIALLVFAAGLYAVVFELIWPGFYLPGVLGAAAALGGLFVLCTHAAQPLLLASAVAAALLLLLSEYWTRINFVSGALATLALTTSFALWSNAGTRIVIPFTLATGIAMTLLLERAKRARRDKTREAAG